MGSRPHRITTLVEKWRFECPRGSEPGDGHTNWFPIDGVFRCKGCAELRNAGEDVEPETARLRDKKTGRRSIARSTRATASTATPSGPAGRSPSAAATSTSRGLEHDPRPER